MTKRSNAVLGSPARRSSVRRFETGRRCSETGCGTVLSAYNEASECWVHTAPQIGTRRTEVGRA